MYVCPQCAQLYEFLPGASSSQTCPSCNAGLKTQASSPWVDVARVNNLAEAGFLSDELNGLDIDARVYQADEFSELGGGWSTTYLLRVPSEAAQEAAAHIRNYVADAAAEEEEPAHGFRFTNEAGPIDPALWRPVALVMLAGVASFVLGRQTAMPEAHRRPQRDTLATAIDGIGRPLVSEAPSGAPRYRLTHDQPRRVWYLDLDRNGDGTYDTRREFQASETGW